MHIPRELFSGEYDTRVLFVLLLGIATYPGTRVLGKNPTRWVRRGITEKSVPVLDSRLVSTSSTSTTSSRMHFRLVSVQK